MSMEILTDWVLAHQPQVLLVGTVLNVGSCSLICLFIDVEHFLAYSLLVFIAEKWATGARATLALVRVPGPCSQ
jgi:hypothetical protein